MKKNPNILLIITEELRNDFLGYMGNPDADTPFLDRLAEEGTVFENHFCVHSKCVPSRAALFSGRYIHVDGHRTLGIRLQKGELNLARILKENGYHTILGRHNHVVENDVLEESFSEFWAGSDLPGESIGYGEYTDETVSNSRKEGDKSADNYIFGKVNQEPEKTVDYRVTRKTVEYINDRKEGDAPFFLNVNFAYTHPPYEIMEPYYSKFMNKDLALLSNTPGEGKPDFVYKLHNLHGFDRLAEQDRKEMLACYLGQLNYVNDRVEEIYQALEESGELENTIFIFTADHGDFVGEYGLPEKWDTVFHDCLINIPLVVRYPEKVKTGRSKALVENIDVMPTLLELAGIEMPYGIQGESLNPILSGETDTHKDYVFVEGGHEKELLDIPIPPDPHRQAVVGYLRKAELREVMPDSLRKAKMIRTETHKLVYRIKDRNELYDLKKDPHEMKNVYDNPEYKDIQGELTKTLLDHLIETEQNLPFDPKPIS